VKGVAFQTNVPFAGAFAPLMARFATLYWLIDTQSGPFDFLARDDASHVERVVDRLSVAVPSLENTSAGLWRPGVFPELAHLLVEDEYTYLVGLRGPEADAMSTASAIASIDYLSPSFFAAIESGAEVFLLELWHGAWEVYPCHRSLADQLARADLQLTDVSSDRWPRRAMQ